MLDHSRTNPRYNPISHTPAWVPGQCNVVVFGSGTIFVSWTDMDGTQHWNDGAHGFIALLVLLATINLPTTFKYA